MLSSVWMHHCSLIGLSVWPVLLGLVQRLPLHKSPSSAFCISIHGAREDIEPLASEHYNVLRPLYEESRKDFWNDVYFPPEAPSRILQCHEFRNCLGIISTSVLRIT